MKTTVTRHNKRLVTKALNLEDAPCHGVTASKLTMPQTDRLFCQAKLRQLGLDNEQTSSRTK